MESQIIKNQEFLNILKEKLSKGNKRSIHLNVLPRNSATRIDLTEIDLIDKSFSEKFIQKLLTNSKFKLDITFDSNFDFNELDEKTQIKTQKAIRRLKSICKQNKDYFLEHGIEPFGFGFPIIYKRDKSDPKSIIKAPLIIWSFEIEENRQYSNKWTIKRDEDFPIYFNDVLISHIERDEGIKIESISKEFLEDSLLNKDELIALTLEFISRFGSELDQDTISQKIFSIIHSESLNDKSDLITEKPAISGSGVFGLYINQKQSIIEDVKALIERIEEFNSEELVNDNFRINHFSSVATDPSQQRILNNIYNNQRIIIHGPPGTGKSQSLTAIITNALSNSAKCLVVCEKRTALDVIYNNLKSIGLEQLCGLIEDTSKDRRRTVDKARDTIDNVLQTKFRYTDFHFDARRYKNLLEETKSLANALNQLHKNIDKSLIGDSNWTNIVGHYLRISKNNKFIEYLETNLPNDQFKFDEDEFNELATIIDKVQNLNSDYNQQNSKLELLNYLKFKDKQFLDIKKVFDSDFIKFVKEINETLEQLPKNNSKFRKILVILLSIVSKQQKLIKKFYNSYEILIDKINDTKYFRIPFDKKLIFKEIELQLISIIKNIHSVINEKDKVHEFVNWHCFKNELSKNQLILVEELIKSPVNIKESFIAWYYNRLLNLNCIAKIPNEESLPEKLISSFEEIKSENTKNALTFWQQRRIDSVYKYNSKHDFMNAKQLYAKVNRDNKKKSLRQIIKQDFELFTDIFPVLLVNPSVCSSIFDLKENLFDVVIFDEASQLRIEDTFCALIRGKIKVISGDEHQMPPSSYFSSTDFSLDTEEYSEEDDNLERQKQDVIIELANKESLLEYATDLNYYDLFLDIHYRSRHPQLIDFSNAAFYGNRLRPMPPISEYKPIRYIQVNGKYDNQVNLLEAKQIILLLKNEIYPNKDGELPSVGIATFNLHQRNLIWDEINKEAKADYSFGNKVEKLFEKGLFIKNLENIQGDERDIIFISTTFGINKSGIFNEMFGPLNIKNKGHRLLNVIISRAKYKIYICTSFPIERIQQYKEHIINYGNIGRGILFAYLAYAKAIEDNDYEAKDFILNLLSENSKSKSSVTGYNTLLGTESPFEQEVVDGLVNNGFEQNRIELQYVCGGFRIDIIVKSIKTNKPVIAIECDGASYHSSNEAYVWDIFRQKQLEQYGFKFFRVWSTNWWQNQKYEIQKLLQYIRDFDNEEIDIIRYNVIDDNLNNNKLLTITEKDKIVKKDSTIKILNIKQGKELQIKFSEQQKMKLNLNSKIQQIYYKAPLAKLLMNNKIGDVIEVEHSGELYKILEIDE